ncbi:hypothetical protein L916_09594, partial [Phytophthora nicotianae]
MAHEDSQLLVEDMKVLIIVRSQLAPCVFMSNHLTMKLPPNSPKLQTTDS